MYIRKAWKLSKEAKLDERNLQDVDYVANLLDEIIVFCEERSLCAEVVLIDSDRISNGANEQLMERMKKHKNIGIRKAGSPQELEEIVCDL